ncbi:carbonic anhydrase [Geobacter sp.]|uniref:carbonic anhydrase n=1 Tax=Geobacter sp. TaxID=46610 RepID=UPI002637DCC3|nr:carbonic anhydrase [Geobacter sp.]
MKVTGSRIARFIIGAAVAVSAAVAFASGGGVGVTADEALQRLMEGNKHFVAGQLGACGESTAAKRASLANGQKPYAIILSCSDSRVPPELIFDKSMGEIFVICVAGNIPDPIVLGSIEYAAEHIGSPLIMVLGHERCGAVTAAVDAKGKPEGNLGAIVRTITPAVRKAKMAAKGKSHDELVETAVEINAKLVAANLTKKSPVIAKLAKEGKVKIVTAKYDLDDGTVSLLGEQK